MGLNASRQLKADRHLIWHPFTQEKTAPPPLFIERAKGAYNA